MPEMKRKRRWFQFSLGTALLILVIASIVFGLVANHAHDRQAAIAAVRTNGGRIRFGPERVPNWYEKPLHLFFGAETYQPVRDINMLTGGRIRLEKKNFRMIFWPNSRPYRRSNSSGWKTRSFLILIGPTSPNFGNCKSFISDTAISQTRVSSILLSFQS